MAALKNVDHISITNDMWTGNQTISYMCVVEHYIYKHWRIQTHAFSIMQLYPPHSKNIIAVALFVCVTEWNIQNNTATMHQTMIGLLKIWRQCFLFEEGHTLKPNIFMSGFVLTFQL
jgi:hypothetical protein